MSDELVERVIGGLRVRIDRACLLHACASCPVDALTVWDEQGDQLVP